MALPTVGSTAPWVRLGHCVGDVESFEEQGRDLDGAARVGVEVRELGVGTEAAAGTVDGLDLVAQDALRLVCARWICHDDGGRRAQGTEGPRRRCSDCVDATVDGGSPSRDVAPEVTTGRVVVVVGGDVVVVVDGEVVVVGDVDAEDVAGSDEVVGRAGWTSGRGVASTWPESASGRCWTPCSPRVLFGHHHADGDGGSGRDQDRGSGQAAQAGVGAPPGLGRVGLRAWSSSATSSRFGIASWKRRCVASG